MRYFKSVLSLTDDGQEGVIHITTTNDELTKYTTRCLDAWYNIDSYIREMLIYRQEEISFDDSIIELI